MKINFKWTRGDDEFETLVVTDEAGLPVDLGNSRFDLHIVPYNGEERIQLSTTTGDIVVSENKISFHVSHAMTKNAIWRSAKWDLQQMTADNLVRTLCGGDVSLTEDVTRV